jgi:hypothetical protein
MKGGTLGMPAYKELFREGSRVKVRNRKDLVQFQQSWKWHHPVSDPMLAYAGQTATVKSVGFYHGGDVLYELVGIAGTWHEACLEFAKE